MIYIIILFTALYCMRDPGPLGNLIAPMRKVSVSNSTICQLPSCTTQTTDMFISFKIRWFYENQMLSNKMFFNIHQHYHGSNRCFVCFRPLVWYIRITVSRWTNKYKKSDIKYLVLSARGILSFSNLFRCKYAHCIVTSIHESIYQRRKRKRKHMTNKPVQLVDLTTK